MTPVIPGSINHVPLIPGTSFATRKKECLKRCTLLRNSTKETWSSRKCFLPLSTSFRLFPQVRCGFSLHSRPRTHILSATGTDVAVEEADSPVSDEDSAGTPEVPPDADGASGEPSVKSATPARKRSRPGRKSEMPPVKPEELVPGATFTGKVRSIQPFGAFVDFGAFTDGLVHVSRLSDSFVKDVGTIVSVGQEVTVRLVEANMETGRISLTMRESDDISKLQQRTDAPASSDKARAPRKGPPRSNQKRDEAKKTSKFVKGQNLEGTVKNLNRSGAFISLPEGEEGFLPSSEELDEGFGNMMGGSSLQVGQEVSVRVLRINRGQVTLTMKKEEDDGELDAKLSQGVVHTATNPFVLAFRKNKDIAAFLDEREKEEEPSEILVVPQISDEIKQKESQTETEVEEVLDQEASSSESDKIQGKITQTTETEVEEVLDKETSSSESEKIEGEGTQITETEVEEVFNKETSGSESEKIKGKVSEKTETEVEEVLDQETSSSETEKIEGKGIQTTETEVQEVLDQESSISETEKIKGKGTQTTETEVGQVLDQETSRSESDRIEGKVTQSGTQTDGIDGAIKNIEEEVESLSTSDQPTEQAPVVDVVENEGESDLSSQDQFSKESTQITNNESPENIISGSLESVESAAKSVEEKMEVISEILSPEKVSSANEEVSSESGLENNGRSELSGEIVYPVTSGSSSEEVTGSQVDNTVVKDEVRIPTAEASAETPVIEENEGNAPEKDSSISGSSEQLGVPTEQQTTSEDSQVSEVKNEIENTEANNEAPSADIEIPSASLVEDEKVKDNGSITGSDGQNGVPSPKDTTTKATISPALVKQLREETGAGMMDCKKALSETGGDLVKAQEFLRKKGLASAEKKASRATAEGRIGSYIHDSRIGVLIEVNCETDFVSRGEIFKELVDDLAMQVAACPQVQYLVTEDVPKEIVEKEREIEMQKEDLLSKPEQIRSKIVDGRIRKRLEELALLEQPYIKNDKMVVKDWVKQIIATIGENIKVKRFVRYNLGEGLEKKSQDFAAEVAAQTAAQAKPIPSPVKEQPPAAADEAKESVDKPPKAMVSAALVKQLREETGAGMMDCKKALSETGGDLEKAQEYLRKKGLSTADKKSSRLAAEGRIGSYIHDSRIGVLIEVNCETDFVGRSEKFKELVDDLAMQVVACPQVQYVSIEDIAQSVVQKEKNLEMQREDLQSKPENIREIIVEGRVSKRLGELALLEQPFIKDDSVLVKDLVKQTVAAIGENIKVRRFVRFTLGETKESITPENEA